MNTVRGRHIVNYVVSCLENRCYVHTINYLLLGIFGSTINRPELASNLNDIPRIISILLQNTDHDKLGKWHR